MARASISIHLLRDFLYTETTEVVGTALLPTVPISFPLPPETTNWVMCTSCEPQGANNLVMKNGLGQSDSFCLRTLVLAFCHYNKL
jgi:hypothetical protein